MKKSRYSPKKAAEFFSAKLAFTTGPIEVQVMFESDQPVTIIDLRDPGDFAQGHIPGAINLPQARWESESGLSKEGINILYCYNQQCHLAAMAALAFARKGYQVMEMEGGWEAWKEFGLHAETLLAGYEAAAA